jgi:hypothetical protein
MHNGQTIEDLVKLVERVRRWDFRCNGDEWCFVLWNRRAAPPRSRFLHSGRDGKPLKPTADPSR